MARICHTILLSTLEKIQKQQEATKPLNFSIIKFKVKVGQKYKHETSKANSKHDFHLDFFCAIPNTMGLSVILTPEDFMAAMSWQFEIDLSHPNRLFNVECGNVGFNLEHATTLSLNMKAFMCGQYV